MRQFPIHLPFLRPYSLPSPFFRRSVHQIILFQARKRDREREIDSLDQQSKGSNGIAPKVEFSSGNHKYNHDIFPSPSAVLRTRAPPPLFTLARLSKQLLHPDYGLLLFVPLSPTRGFVIDDLGNPRNARFVLLSIHLLRIDGRNMYIYWN